MQRFLFVKSVASAFILAALAAAPYAHANVEDRRLSIINNSDENIISFRVSHVYQEVYSRRDLLGDEVIEPGWQMTVNTDDGNPGCMYDFRTLMGNGAVLYRNNVNVCRINSYTITGD
jgi:hypothetical protein